jgi:DNA-binding transcriptional MerR regulator/methylmalonyl-CoA mutase cobalamin-binding subunit
MTADSTELSLLTIGEVSQRVAVPATTLRAWERRYGVPSPSRTSGRYRLYGRQALDEITALVRHRAAGIRPQQAAMLVRHGRVAAAIPKEHRRFRNWRQRLERACLRFDDAGAEAVVADAAREVGLLTAFKDVILPIVAQLGDAWHEGLISISQEHFVSQLAHRVALQLSRVDTSVARSRPRVITGCAPGERHELGLLLLVVELKASGHEVVHLGCDVPVGAFLEALDSTRARLAVIGVTMATHLRDWHDEVRQVRRRERRGVRFVWAGPGAGSSTTTLPGVAVLSAAEITARSR